MKEKAYLFVLICILFNFKLSSQTVQGSFESPYKRYIKGEKFSGALSLSEGLTGWKGERVYSQLVLWSSTDEDNLTFESSDFVNGTNVIPRSNLKLMFAHNVLADREARTCGTYPSPRLDEVEIADALSFSPTTNLKATDPLKIWVRFNIPNTALQGNYKGTITVRQNGSESQTFHLSVEVLDKTLPEVDQWRFHLDLWQYPYQLLKHYNEAHPNNTIPIWSNAHFDMIRPYYQLLADAGQKVVTAHISDGAQGQPSMIKWIRKMDGTWDYDFTAFDKYVNEMAGLGITKQINCFSPVGFRVDKIPYFDQSTGTNQELMAPIGSSTYITRWDHFLSAFKKHLMLKGWFDKSIIYLDEVAEELLRDIINMIQGNDSNWKIGLAYFHPVSSEINNDIYDLTGNLGLSTTEGRTGKISTFYTSCAQTFPNSYVTPENDAAEMAWMGWHVANQNLDGYLRWAYDYWRSSNPFSVQDGAHTSGDFSLIYRGSNELNAQVYSSYRFEMLRKGIQDYEKIRILKAELKDSSDSFNLEALNLLNTKIGQFHKNSGEGATALVAQGSKLLNNIVTESITYCKVDGHPISSGYTQWVGVSGSNTELGNTWASNNLGAYSRYSGGKISVAPGATFSMTIENSQNSNCARTGIWIDWNGDLDFEDVGEAVWNGGSAHSCNNPTSNTIAITVPMDANIGLSRLRIQVRNANDDAPQSCGTVSNASTRDFEIEILDMYCQSTTVYNNLYFIKKMSIAGCGAGNLEFSNTVAPLNGYIHDTTSNAELERGSTFTLKLENSNSSNCARTALWIDWNSDLDFNDSGEQIITLGEANSCTNPLSNDIVITVPETAVLGKSRMRLQLRDSFRPIPSPCLLDGVAGTTDIDVNIIVGDGNCNPVLVGPVNGQNLNGTVETFSWNPNNRPVDSWKLKISDTPESPTSFTYYEQEFNPSVTSVEVNTLPSRGEEIAVELFWQIDGKWFSDTTYNRGKDIYCTSFGSINESYYVQSLTTSRAIENIEYLTPKGAPEGGYTYHRSTQVVAKIGSSFSIQMTPSAASNCARTKFWVDWNEDGDFLDSGEEIYSSGNAESCRNPYSHNFSITVPNNGILAGTKRMRIRMRDAFQAAPEPCGTFNFTGTTDFQIEVIAPTKIAPNYSTDFNELEECWVTGQDNSNGFSGVKQASKYPYPKKVLQIGRLTANGNDPVSHASLWTDLSGISKGDIILSVNHAAYGNPYANIPLETGIFLSDDAGYNFIKVFDSFNFDVNFHTSSATLNISQLATQYNLMLNDKFVIKFQHKANYIYPEGVELWNINLNVQGTSLKAQLLRSEWQSNENNYILTRGSPNPTNNLITVHLGANFVVAEKINVDVFDMSGKSLIQKKIDVLNRNDKGEFKLNLETLPNGIFLIKGIGLKSGEQFSTTIIKN